MPEYLKGLNTIFLLTITALSNGLSQANDLSADSLRSLGNSAYNSQSFEEASALYTEAYQKYYSEGSFQESIEVLNYANHVDYYLIENFTRFNENSVKAMQLAKTHLTENDIEYIWALEQNGTYYYSISDYLKAKQINLRTLDLKIKNDFDADNIYNTKISIANCYKFLGDHKNARLYFDDNKKLENTSTEVKSRYYHAMTRYYERSDQLDSAYHYALLLDKIVEDVLEDELKIEYLLTAAEISAKNNLFNQAEKFILKTSQYPITGYNQIYQLETRGKIMAYRDEHEQALDLITKAHRLAERINKKNTASFKSKRLQEMYNSARAIEDEGRVEEILTEGILSNYLDTTTVSNKLSPNKFTNKLEALFFSSKLAELNLKKYEAKDSLHCLESARDNYLLSVDLLLQTRKEIFTDESKNTLSRQSEDIIDGAIKSAILLYEASSDKRYIEEALIISEKNKALNLLDKFSDEYAKSSSEIPDSIVDSEKELILRLNQASKIFLESPIGSDAKNEYKNEMDKVSLELDLLVHRIEREYPRYYELKYLPFDFSVSTLRNDELSDRDAIVEYHMGEKELYSFVITRHSIDVIRKTTDDNLNLAIDTFSTLISRFPDSKNSRSEYHSFVRNGTYLYKVLIKDQLQYLDTHIRSVSLIPHRYLNYIPFDLLVRSTGDQESYALDNIEYLFEDYALSYQYSINHWGLSVANVETEYKSDYIGFAPVFQVSGESTFRNCDGLVLKNLKCNTEEIESAAHYFDGDFFKDDIATLDNFLTHIGKTKIVHLATHTCIDQNNTGLNKIYFTDGDISVTELNAYNMTADLAILSACNTGKGDYVSGDGVQSLAWAFAQAGCLSTVMSLWSIDDCTTTDFMNNYFNYLNNGIRKDEALQKAKVKYLKTAPKMRQHPFYWASFVTYGNMQPIYESSNHLLLIVCFVLCLMFLFLLMKKLVKRNQ